MFDTDSVELRTRYLTLGLCGSTDPVWHKGPPLAPNWRKKSHFSVLYVTPTWKYFPSTGPGWLHTATGSFHESDSGTSYMLRWLLWASVLVRGLRPVTKNSEQCPPRTVKLDLGEL